ncbi:MAG: glycosyltransferase family 4 protein [Anaerolineales bacterium]
MHLAYLCQYFVPEPGAPSARLYDLARAWVEAGHQVTVLTGMPNHPTGVVPPEYRRRLVARETLDGITVLRNWLYATPNEGFFRKTVSHLSFMVSVVLFGLPRLSGVDVLIVSSPAFFAVFAAWFISRARRIPYIFEVRDLWPAVFVDLGVLTNPRLIRLLEFWEMFLYRRSARVVTVTESFRRNLLARGLSPEKVITIPNGAALDFFQPGPRENAVRAELGLTGKFVVSYIGAHGISHALETVLYAAERMREENDVIFLLVGEGAQKRALRALRERLGLENVRMIPAQPKARVPDFYRASDVCLVPLRSVRLFESFIPSKMFEIMACGVPLIGAMRGEARTILERSGAARLTEPENVEQLVAAIDWFRSHPKQAQHMGAAGREFVQRNYDRRELASHYLDLLQDVVR